MMGDNYVGTVEGQLVGPEDYIRYVIILGANGMKNNTLDNYSDGDVVCINKINDNSHMSERLMEMGLTIGTVVQIVRCGILGNPLQIKLRGYMLSIRKEQAHNILCSLYSKEEND